MIKNEVRYRIILIDIQLIRKKMTITNNNHKKLLKK